MNTLRGISLALNVIEIVACRLYGHQDAQTWNPLTEVGLDNVLFTANRVGSCESIHFLVTTRLTCGLCSSPLFVLAARIV